MGLSFSMSKIIVHAALLASVLISTGCRERYAPQPASQPIAASESNTTTEASSAINSPSPATSSYELVKFGTYDTAFRFTGSMPTEYQIEYVPEIRSINIYDPAASGATPREQSQIFIRFFEASDFLTLSTVDILKREEVQLKGHTAVRYEIKKKEGIAPFPSQPRWRNEQHSLIDVRLSESRPTLFYVFSYNPALPEAIFQHFMNSLIFDNDQEGFISPLDDPRERVTKKPFGTQVSPDNSPVQPERFLGYHTGIDFEVSDDEREREFVKVRAFCGGEIIQKKQAAGYGGVIVQECMIDTET